MVVVVMLLMVRVVAVVVRVRLLEDFYVDTVDINVKIVILEFTIFKLGHKTV